MLEAIAAGYVRRVLIAHTVRPGGIISEIEAAARLARVPVQRVPARDIERRARGQVSQGVIAEIRRSSGADMDDILERARVGREPPFVLVVDQIQDPHNFGSLLRTAEAAGVHGVIVPKAHNVDVTGVVAKASAGAAHHVSIAAVPNLVREIDRLKEVGLWVAGLEMEAGQTIYQTDLTGPLAVVIGGEGKGMRRLTREHLDLVVRIPLRGKVASLNASVAGAIAMFEVVRQRTSG